MNMLLIDTALQLALIVAACAIAGGIILFFIACIFRVKKGTCIIIEKMGEFYGIYKPGIYFFWPFLYRRRGTYPLEEAKRQIRLNNGKKALVTYKIKDVKKYHYTDISIETCFNKTALKYEKVTLEILKNELDNIGIELIDLKQIEETI